MPRRVAVPIIAAAAALLWGGAPLMAQVRPTRALPFEDVRRAPRTLLLQYLRDSLSFDTSTAVSDDQRLSLRDRRFPRDSTRLVLGPRAIINPEKGAHLNTRRDLEQGRIVARVQADGSYPKLDIRRGTNYLWVRRVDEYRFDWAMIADTAEAEIVVHDTGRYYPHDPPYPHPQASARWIFVPWDDGLWVSCDVNGCCKLE